MNFQCITSASVYILHVLICKVENAYVSVQQKYKTLNLLCSCISTPQAIMLEQREILYEKIKVKYSFMKPLFATPLLPFAGLLKINDPLQSWVYVACLWWWVWDWRWWLDDDWRSCLSDVLWRAVIAVTQIPFILTSVHDSIHSPLSLEDILTIISKFNFPSRGEIC